MLGDGLDLESRNGLALFLRRGMWGWLQAAATLSTRPRDERPVVARLNTEGNQQAVVILLAALAKRTLNRRAHERIS